jgi:hypothetical protein
MDDLDIKNTKISYDLQPVQTNQYIMRLYNLADRFDDRRELGFDSDHFMKPRALVQVAS